ncbi:MAG: WbqC family protein [Tannerellaceae bacterium]|jgi:hypothetical protein|nr:WbqC family protein [Tannerellaceae bacterium]
MEVYLSTAYLAPIQYYCRLLSGTVYLETCEHFVKQSFRNRCLIGGANGLLTLTIPVEKPRSNLKIPIRDVRISEHGRWRHQHWQALVSAYRKSPFFDYYEEDFAPFYHRSSLHFLFDFNEELRRTVCHLLGITPIIRSTNIYFPSPPNDYRNAIHPKHKVVDPLFLPISYYQVFSARHSFLPNLSIADLLFNEGPEALSILRHSFRLS